MTSEAPKEIWIEDEFGEGHEDQWSYGSWDCRNVDGYVTSYTLTTHALAMVATERWALACRLEFSAVNTQDEVYEDYLRDLAASIRARTPADAQAALDALLRAERVKALREAAEIVRGLAPAIEHDSTQDDRMHESILERAARHIERAVE